MAVRERATDVHIEPSASSYHLLLRIDGVRGRCLPCPQASRDWLCSSNLAPTWTSPNNGQDGSFQARILETNFTLRVSSLVSEYGERLVLRLLPERNDLARLDRLGFRDEDIHLLKKVFGKPAGMVLLTGPTGSGKTTTLHAAHCACRRSSNAMS